MSTPHIHAELIHYWADGGEVEYQSRIDGSWYSYCQPTWNPENIYRKKPIPKPDIVKQYFVSLGGCGEYTMWAGVDRCNTPNVKLTFDAETRQLKDVELIK